MTWIYSIPAWLVCILFIGGTSAFAAVGLLLARNPRMGRLRAVANDFAGPVMGALGTILAVMLSFMVVTVWQEYDQSAQIVETEASQISNLYHEVAVFPEPLRDQVRSAIIRYVNVVVKQEWPLMSVGRESPAARRSAMAIVSLVQSYSPTTMAQQNSQADALDHAHAMLDAREDRLFQNSQAVPPLLWVMMLFVALVTLCSSYFFFVADVRAHLAMTIALGAVIGAIFVVIAELDLPFRGDLQIPPTAYAHDYRVFADDPVSSKYLPNAPGSTQP
ncbi:MAG TPA: DUF4239 domain-containing protein [Candidatus Baltobacteraceae bacterium]|nr:DUF4239 domain-containing protein [Candidatus Baltobacteraceae bacterium]